MLRKRGQRASKESLGKVYMYECTLACSLLQDINQLLRGTDIKISLCVMPKRCIQTFAVNPRFMEQVNLRRLQLALFLRRDI